MGKDILNVNCKLKYSIMQPLKLQASHFFYDRMLPVRLFYTRCSEVADWHTHEFSEIAILLAGSAVYETDFGAVNISAGEVMVMPSGGNHRFLNEKNVEQFNLLFQFEKLPVPSLEISRHPGFSSLFRLNPEYCRRQKHYPRFRIEDPETLDCIRLLLTHACNMQEKRQPGYMMAVYGAFLQLVPILLDNFCRSADNDKLRQTSDFLADCLDFIQQNFRRELTTTQLARKARMAPASFVRHFRSATGFTPQEYLIHMRLEEALVQLQNPDLSIAEAALNSGFNDSNYFSRLFRLKKGISPREYRRQL